MDVLWINVAYIARLIKRFTLLTIRRIPEAIPMLRMVVPVTIIDELLKDVKIASVSLDLSAAAGTYTAYHTVPDGKRWVLRAMSREATIAVSRVMIYDGTNQFNIFASNTAFETDNKFTLPLKEGWSIGMWTTGDVGDTAIYLMIYYEEEEAYQ